MSLHIHVDTTKLDGLLAGFTAPDYREVGQAMDLAGAAAAAAWEAAASGAMLPGTTRRIRWPQYAASVQHHLRGELAVVIGADDAMTAAATEARPAWDMKPGLLGGPHARQGKHGRYNVIPFAHEAEHVSDEAMMALIRGVRNYRGTVGWRTKLGIPAAPGHYTWTTGPESGIRMTHAGIRTWRTVSDASPPASWWYPARPANPLIDAVWRAVRDDVEEEVFEAWVRAFGLDGGGTARP